MRARDFRQINDEEVRMLAVMKIERKKKVKLCQSNKERERQERNVHGGTL